LGKSTAIENDMLKGNINRMFVAHDRDELNQMYIWSIKRLTKIYEDNYCRILLEQNEVKEDEN